MSEDLEPNNKSKLVSIGTAAKILGVSIDTIRRWDKKGKLHSARPDGKNRYFSIDELEAVKLAKPLTITQVADKLNISPATLRRLEEKGLIRPDRNKKGERLYTLHILQAYLDSQYFMRHKEVQEEVLAPLKKPAPKPSIKSSADELGDTMPTTNKPSYITGSDSLSEDEILKETDQSDITKSSTDPKKGQDTNLTHRVYDFVLAQNQRHINRLVIFRRAFFTVISLLIILLFVLVTSISFAFVLYPAETGQYLGYRHHVPHLIARNPSPGQETLNSDNAPKKPVPDDSQPGRVLGATWPGPWAERSAAAKAMLPFSSISLQIVKIIDPYAYQQAITERIIPNVNDIFTIDRHGNITTMYNFTFPDTSYLQIPDQELITNLNADYLRGRVPGSSPGNLIYLDHSGNLQIPGTITTQSISADSIQDGAITNDKIAEDAVATFHLQDDSIFSEHIKDGQVKEQDLQDSTVTTIKIADNSVTSAKIQDGQVKEQDLATDSVTTTKIGDSAVTTAKIAANAITATKINDQAVTSAKIADDTIQTVDVQDGAITAAKIANDTLDYDKFQADMDLDEDTNIDFGAFDLTLDLDSTGDLIISDAGTAIHIFNDSGNVGINTTTPNTFLLEVAGNVGPSADSTYDLGANTTRWQMIYADTVQTTELAATGATVFNSIRYYWPNADGSSTQVLTTDGAGNLSWATSAGGGGTIDGSGTANYLTKWLDSDTLTDSLILESGLNIQAAANLQPTTDSTYELGTSALRWDALYVGSINTEGNIVPTTDSTYDLGSSSLRWANIYADSIQPGNLNANSIVYANSSGQLDTNPYLSYNTDGNVGIGVTSPSDELHIIGSDPVIVLETSVGPSELYIRFDNSETSAAFDYTFGQHSGAASLQMRTKSDNNSHHTFAMAAGLETVHNEQQLDINFRIESNNRSHIFYMDAGTDTIGINETAPDAMLEIVSDAAAEEVLHLKAAASQSAPILTMTDSNDNIFMSSGDGLASSEVVWNEQGADIDFRVEGAGAANALFVQGSDGFVGMGTTSPTATLTVNGTSTFLEALTADAIYPNTDSSYDLGTSALRWDALYVGSINTEGNIVPTTDSTYDLGTSSLRWANIYADSIQPGNLNTNSIVYANSSGELDTNPYLSYTTGGNVGIGTTAPDQNSHVHKGSAGSVSADASSALVLEHSSDVALSFLSPNTTYNSILFGDPENNATGRIRYYHNDNHLDFYTNNAEAMRIVSSGNVGINTTAPTSFKLQTAGNVGPNTDSTYELGSSSLRWDALYVGSIQAEGNIVPSADSTYNLGTDSVRWLNVFSDSVESSTLIVSNSGTAQIPVGTGPTVDLSGEVAIDTSADQLVFYGAASKRVLTYQEYKSITIDTPADTDNFNLFKAPHALTITDIECVVDPADSSESVVIDIQERDSAGDNPATVDATITCDNDGASDDGSLSNGSIDSGDWVSIDIGTVTGTVTQVTVTVTYTVDAQ